MKAVLFRTGSVPVHVRSSPVSGSPQRFISRTASLNGDRASKVISLNCEANRRRSVIRRALSEAELPGGIGSFPASIPDGDRSRSVLLSRSATGFGVSLPELGFPGGGSGNGKNSGGGGFGGDSGGRNRGDLGEYYERMLRMNPGDSLLLRNYGKYLYEVVRDLERAEEYYGRAILASDGRDGELFSLYGQIIWEMHRDSVRAKFYFDQAVSASPDDCTILGSYAHFMWEAGDDEEEEEEDETNGKTETNVLSAGPLVPAF